MNTKSIRLSPKRGGHGHITSYSINVGSLEARSCGFVSPDGEYQPLEKFIDSDNSRIIIQLKKEVNNYDV